MFMLIFSKTLKLSFNLNKDNINQKGDKKTKSAFYYGCTILRKT